MIDNKNNQNSTAKSYLVNVGGKTEVWDEATYTELKDALYNKYPDANMFEMDNMTDFSAVDDEMQYVVNTGDRTETWDAATMKELGSALKEKYPNATVQSLKYKDYWYDKALADEESLKTMQGELESLNKELGGKQRWSPEYNAIEAQISDKRGQMAKIKSDYDANPRVVAYNEEMAAAQAEAEKRLPVELRNQTESALGEINAIGMGFKEPFEYGEKTEPIIEGVGEDGKLIIDKGQFLKNIENYKNTKNITPGMYAERTAQFTRELSDYKAASSFLDAYDYLKNNKSSVAQGAWYNLNESASQFANEQVHDVLAKLESKCGNLNEVTPEDIDNNLSQSEKVLIQSYFLAMGEEAKVSKAFRGGEIAGESAKIAAEVIVYDLALNALIPGAGTAAHVASATSKATKVASAISKWYNSGSKLTKLGKGVVKLTGATAKLGMKATGFTALAPTTYSHIAKKKLTIGDDGKLKDSDEDIMRYFAEDVVENFTELSGEGVLKLFGKAGDLAKGTRIGAKIADRMDSSWFGKAGKWLATNSGTKWFKRAGFHGLPVEVFEEFEGAVINQFTGLDENAISNFADKDNLTTMMIGFAPMTLLGMGTGIGSYAYASHSVDKNAKNLSKVLLDNGYNEEQVKYLLNYERQKSPESLGKEINNVLAVMEQNGASAEAKKAVTDYAVAVGRYKALEGSFEAQQPKLKNKKLKELNSKYGTFYQTKNDGKNKLDEVTTTYVLPQGETKGRDVFIVSEKNDNGQYDAIDVNTGERLKVSDSEIALLRSEDMSPVFTTRSLDTYLTERVMEERQKTLSDYEAAYENGQEMTVADLSSLNEQEQQAKDNLLNTGITSRENSFTEDSINLSSSELLSLSEQDDFTEEESNAIRELAIAKRTNEGLIDKLKQPIISSIDSRNSIASNASNNGTLTVGTHNGKTVYVKGGVQTSNGSIVKPDNAKGYPVEIVDAATGEVSVVDSKEVTNAGNVNTATWNRSYEVGMIKAFEQKIEELRNAKSPNAILSEVYELVGKKVYLNINDNIILVEVDQILPSMEVLIKGKKGDLGGKSVLAVGIDEFYNMIYRDANGNPVLPKEEQEESEVTDYRGETVSILINGVPASVEVISQDNSSDSIVYEYTDENGNTKHGRSTISEFGKAIEQANEYVPEQPNVPEEVPVAETQEQPIEESPSEEVTTEEPVEAPVENIPLDPESINWDELFEQDKEAYFVEMQNQFGEEAVDVLNEEIDAAQSELDALGKVKTKSQNDRIKNRNKKKALQSRIDALNEMVARLTTTPESKIITEPTQEAPVKTIAFGASVNNEDRLEIPKKPVIKRPRTIKGMSALDPMTSTELAARELGLKNGGIKLTKESFLHHTGYGTSEANALKGLFLSKDKGGKTVEEAGERLMEIDREYDLGLFDQNDPNAGINAILEALSENRTMGELRSYIARQRQAEAQREADAIYAYEMEQYEKILDDALRDDVFAEELKAGKAYTEDEYNELMTILAEEINDYDTGNQGEIDILYETEDIGDLPAAEGEAHGGIERSNQVLQETQSVQTSGERDSQRRGANQNIVGEDASSPVHNGESSDNERGSSEEEFVSSLDEDMPDFTQESERVPVAPNPVADPVSEAKNREERLMSLIERKGVSDALKRDSAFNAGKEVADFFATYSEFEEYEAEAKDLGNYYEDFARGVKASFSNRPSNESHIGEAGLEVSSEAQELTLDAVLESLDNNIEVEAASDQQAQAMLDVKAELSGIEAMTVYHGSPHKFSAFDHSKMGTGEGAQAHGWGTYVAVNRQTSEEYADVLRGRLIKITRNGFDISGNVKLLPMDAKTPLELIATLIDWYGIDNAKAELEKGLKEAEQKYKESSVINSEYRRAKVEMYKNASVLLNSGSWKVEQSLTNLYTVNIPEDSGSNYFGERELTDRQMEMISDACEREGVDFLEVSAISSALSDKREGARLYKALSEVLGSPKDASEFLSRAGFTGIKYTGNVDGDCFVIFNESDAKITGHVEFYQTPNGTVYGWTDGKKIYLTKAGFNPNSPIHEYTHLWAKAMMQKNPKGWNSVKSLLKGTPIWNEVINDPNYSDIKDNEDSVASEALSRLSGSQNAAKMEQMAQQMIDEAKGTMRKAKARGLIQNMKDALAKFWNWVGTNLFGIEKFDSVEQVTDRVLWDLLNKTDLGIQDNGNGKIEFSISTWENGGRDYLANWLKNDQILEEDEKADILARMDEFYENAQKYTDVYVPFGAWSEAAVKFDKDGSPLMSVIKKNGDYAMNLDFSLVCKKRRPLNTLLRELIKRNAFGTYTLRERELAEINWILQDHGFEVACALCFVDSKRFRVTGVADVFATLYNNFVKALAPEGAQIAHFNYSNNPNVESVENGLDTMPDEQLNWEKFDKLAAKYGPKTVEGKVAAFLRDNPSQRKLVDATDFIDSKGFEAVKEGNPKLLSLYNSKKGTGGPKASFGDVQYLNDILKKDNAFDVEKAYEVGGVRLQSFSDFVPHMYFDYMQLFAELAAKKLPAHAYTKEALFAKIFGMSGIKINMSLVPSVVEGGIAPGLDANGNYTWSEAIKDKDGNIIQQGQSFPFDEAMTIQNAEGYSKNCGVIAVGISDAHIEKMLGDPNIPFIIPYHKSSLNAIVARMTNIDKYKDYTKSQNTTKADGTKIEGEDFNFNAYLHEHKDATPQQAAQAYLDWCKENNYRPKFSQFAYHQNYYKLLQDFNTVDATTGEYAPQGAVTMTFPTKDSAFGDVEILIQQGLAEDVAVEEKMESEMSKVADEVEARLKEIAKEPKVSKKKQASQMAKLADERQAKIKEKADESDGLLFRSSDSPITPEMDADYLAAVERGDMETAQRMVLEAAKLAMPNTKVVDENGNPMVVYHGSPYSGITEFDRTGRSVSGLREYGSYFSTNETLARLYAYSRRKAQKDIDAYEEEKARLESIAFSEDTPVRETLDAFDDLDRLRESNRPKVYKAFLNIENPKVFDAEGSNGWDGWHKLTQDVGYDIKRGIEAIEAISGHNRAARMSEKYDGIIAKNMADVHSEATEDLMGDVFLVFDENPNQIKSADPVTYDENGNVIPLSERFNPEKKDIRYRKSDIQNAAVDFLAGPQRTELIQRAVNEEAQKLGVTVTYKTRSEMPKGHENDKGYYNTKTGEIVICTENNADINDAIQTILHEAVAHKGLRQLMGDKFNEFINRVYNSLDAETKAKVDSLAEKHYNGDKMVAMEEYMASLAENENFAETSVWEKIKSIFESIINSILGRNDIKIGDKELRYILRASYNNMVNPNAMNTIEGWAKDTNMRNELGINEATPEIMSRTGIDATEVARESAKQVYDNVVTERWQEFQRQFQDAYQPVRIAIEAIQQETGNIPIEDYENYLLIQNQTSSRSRVEIDNFERKYYEPIIEQVNKIIDRILEARGLKNNKKNRAEVYAEVRQYMIAKHGLERNKYYQEHKTRPLNKEEKELARKNIEQDYADELARIASNYTGSERKSQEALAKQKYEAQIEGIRSMAAFDVRDYSGLTSLFGLDPSEFEDAEMLAQDVVDEFEKELGRVDDKTSGKIVKQSAEIDALWNKINSATDKTLRHSYESGMISRQQYDHIRTMFDFYIPLRGFDETTAEDVYSYARFEGNRFNAAVHKAEGRTSVADDPIATIMNMAESEIAQGNKNRAKQALYNFILNRPVMGENGMQKQNSLMQVEDVWYVKVVDSTGNEVYQIAAPGHEYGETYEEFEERMASLEAEEKAFKSKKGQVDVGKRFQKQRNQNAHYIYLKINGVDKAIYINGDPKAADAVNGTYQQKRQFGEDKFRQINRLISSTFTNYSLEFTARNFFRDMFYSHINMGVKEKDPAYRKTFRKNWRKNNMGTMLKMLKAYRAGEYDNKELNATEAAFVEFMENGGQTGYTLINSVESHKKELEKSLERMRKGSRKGGLKNSTVFKYTLGGIELLNEASELVTRFAAFKSSRDMGRSVVESINDAKEITVNFNTKGAQDGTGWMGFIARYFGWSKYFFNASVQGVQNIKAMANANKLKFCGVVGGMMGLGFLMPVITSAIASMLGGDDDEYWNIPEYDRQNNLCICIGGGNYIKIPLPIGFREIYAMGDMTAALAFDKRFPRDIWSVGMDYANKIASIILPINPLEGRANGLSFWNTFLSTALPSSFQFAIQNATNTDWKGAPLQKEYTWNEDDPQWMKAFENAPDWMVGLSKWCNENINLDGDYRGLVDWSPEKLDNTLSNLFGGVYTLIKKTGNGISAAWNEEERNLSNIPLAGVVFGTGIESDGRFVTDAYFDMKEYYDANVNSIKRVASNFGLSLEDIFVKQKGAHHPKIQEIYGNKNFEWMKDWYLGHEGNRKGSSKAEKLGLNQLRQDIKDLQKSIAEREERGMSTEKKEEKLIEKQKMFDEYYRDFTYRLLEMD